MISFLTRFVFDVDNFGRAGKSISPDEESSLERKLRRRGHTMTNVGVPGPHARSRTLHSKCAQRTPAGATRVGRERGSRLYETWSVTESSRKGAPTLQAQREAWRVASPGALDQACSCVEFSRKKLWRPMSSFEMYIRKWCTVNCILLTSLKGTSVNGSHSPHGQSFSGLLGQFRRIHEHQFEEEFQIPDVSGQPGAEDPGPVPTLAFPSSTKVNDDWKSQFKEKLFKTALFSK